MKTTEKNIEQKTILNTGDILKQTISNMAVCSECGALYTDGRWSWNDIPEEASSVLCPACERIKSRHPAAVVVLKGTFFQSHNDEIMKLVQQIQRKETSEYPLERVIEIREHKTHTEITTTGAHMAGQIGQMLFDAYKGNLNYKYDDKQMVRVSWRR